MKYRRAPITEAVIELRFARPLEQSVVERATNSIANDYFYKETEQGINVVVEAANQPPKVETIWEGVKLSSLDRADVVVFRRGAFVCSRLAPYMGWEEFLPAVQRAWSAHRKAAGTVEITRIGLRYVNRIDIPVTDDEPINAEDYLNYVPEAPMGFKPMATYVIQTNRPLGEDDCHFTALSSTVVPSPLINTISLTLDLDVYREINIPRRDDQLWALIDRMRGYKNSIFEACITDRARELFK
jgi:uncharacterized protein (TIGR04255 family)